MALTVTINSIAGSPNYDVWISNSCESSSTKLYIDTIDNSDIPYTFVVPPTFENGQFCVKIYDDNECEVCECYNEIPAVSPSPTPSITPTITISPSITPTPTPTATCVAPSIFIGSFMANNFVYNAVYTMSLTLYNGKTQWTSPSNGTIRWNGFRWEIAGWSPSGVIYYNTNPTLISPDTTSWVYQNCVPGQTCSISMETQGCGEPTYYELGTNFYSVKPTSESLCGFYTANTSGSTTYYALVDETTFYGCPEGYIVYEYVLGSYSPVANGFIGRDPFGSYGGCWLEINNSGGINGEVVDRGSCTGASCTTVGTTC